MNTCKQPDTAKIVSCPKFMKRPTEDKFRAMVDNLDSVEKAAKKKQRAIRQLINEALAADQDSGDEGDDFDDNQGG